LLAACGLTDQQKADYARVQRSGVSPAVYDKMVHQDALSLWDLKALARAGVSDAIVLRYLRDQHTVYYLSSDDVTGLRKAGVSQSVVDYMLQSPRQYSSSYYYGPYPYYYDPFFGPPYPYYWGGGGWGYYHRHWH
jgi:hypothetical protein